MAPLLRVRGLGRDHDGVVALDGLDLELERGACLGLLGHNGSGKTTAVGCLGGHLTPSRGRIEVAGVDAAADPARVAPVRAVVPDPAAGDDELTARQQLERVAEAHGLGSATERAVTTVLETFGLTSRQHALPHQLSRGLRQRVALACGFVRPFDLLVLDEPSRYLDEGATEQLVGRLEDELARGAGIVLTSHDPQLAGYLADELVILEDGRVADRGTPQAVLAGEAARRAGLLLADG